MHFMWMFLARTRYKRVYVWVYGGGGLQLLNDSEGKCGSSGERQKKKKKFNLPRSLQCCNCWVCAGVSLLLNVPQLQGRHQVVDFAAAFVWRDDET